MYKILVPFDFSKEAKVALTHAVSIAEHTNAKITLLYVASNGQVPSFHTQGAQLTSNVDDAAFFNFLKKIESKLEKVANDQVVKPHIERHLVKVANYEKTIEEIITDMQVDLILMGTEGFHGSEEVFINSTSESVTAVGKIPVMVVKENTPVSQLNKVIYASNYESDHDLNAASLAKFLLETDAVLHLVKVLKKSNQDFEQLRQQIAKIASTIQPKPEKHIIEILLSEQTVDALQLYADKNNIDVIAINSSKLDGLFRFFRESIVEEIVNRVNKPVLLLNQD